MNTGVLNLVHFKHDIDGHGIKSILSMTYKIFICIHAFHRYVLKPKKIVVKPIMLYTPCFLRISYFNFLLVFFRVFLCYLKKIFLLSYSSFFPFNLFF